MSLVSIVPAARMIGDTVERIAARMAARISPPAMGCMFIISDGSASFAPSARLSTSASSVP